MREQCRTCGKNHVDIGACQPRGGYVGTFTVTCVDPKDARIRELEAEVERLRAAIDTVRRWVYCDGMTTHQRWEAIRDYFGIQDTHTATGRESGE